MNNFTVCVRTHPEEDFKLITLDNNSLSLVALCKRRAACYACKYAEVTFLRIVPFLGLRFQVISIATKTEEMRVIIVNDLFIPA